MAYAELKAEFGYQLARHVGEAIAPNVGLGLSRRSGIEEARELDRTGDFLGAAEQYLAIFYTSELTYPAIIRAEAQIGAAQQLINLGDFSQARERFLMGRYDPISELRGHKRDLYEALRHSKLAWIYDYETGFSRSLTELETVQQLLSRIPTEVRDEDYENVELTNLHFRGRAHFGLANQGIEPEENLLQAVGEFGRHLDSCQQLRDEGRPRPDEEGFDHGWLARCYLKQEMWSSAADEIGLARVCFLESADGNQEAGIMAHYYLLEGELLLRNGSPITAKSYFSEAIRIRREVQNYPKGAADGHLGLFRTSWKLGEPKPAAQHFIAAVRAHPYSVFRSTFGG